MKNILCLLLLFLILHCGTQKQIPKPRLETAQPEKKLSLPFIDDFNDGKPDNWTITNDVPTEQSTWKIEQGMLVQGSSLRSENTASEGYLGTHITAGTTTWRDYVLTARMRNMGSGGVGVLFRYSDQQNYYRLFLLKSAKFGGPKIILDKCVNGNFMTVYKVDKPEIPTEDETFSIRIKAFGDTLEASLSNQMLFQVRDSSHVTGKIGFSCFANPILCVDDVMVRDVRDSLATEVVEPGQMEIKRNHFSGDYPFAIRGIVFRDNDGNGRQGEDEPGIPNIAVSDGCQVVQTNQLGVYSLKNSSKNAQFVFVTIPTNYEKTSGYYYLLDDSLRQKTFNFPLRPQKQFERLPMTFAQITDIHLDDAASVAQFDSLLAHVLEKQPQAGFIVATGDLVQEGSIAAQLAAYSQSIRRLTVPVFSIFGNHDKDNGLNQLHNFHKVVGPDYFSFEYADWHFVSYNSSFESEKQLQWLINDFKMCSAKKNILLFQHHPPTEVQLERYAKYNVKAVFYGHSHASRIFEYKTMQTFCTPPLGFGGIDVSPAGYRSVTIDRDEFSTQFCTSQLSRQIRIASPQPGEVHTEKYLDILVNIYDYPVEIRRVDFQLTSTNNFNEIGELQQKGKWTWKKSLFESLVNGNYNLSLTITTTTGEKLRKAVNFSVQLGANIGIVANENWPMFKQNSGHNSARLKALSPPLSLKWIASTNGTIDFGSPIVMNNIVAIASKDRDGLSGNHICAFHAGSGELVWCYETETAVNHTLAANEHQIFGQDVLGNIYAFDLERGDLLWQNQLEKNGIASWLYTAPLIMDDQLFCGSAADFAALDPETGTVLWKKKLQTSPVSSYSSPAGIFDQLFVGSLWKPTSIYSVEARTGERMWEYAAAGTHATPLVLENVIYMPTQSGKLAAINPENGAEIWQVPLGKGWPVASPANWRDLIITDSGDGRLLAFQKESGQLAWQFQFKASLLLLAPYKNENIALCGSPVVAGDVVYVTSTDGFLYALDCAAGFVKWKYELGVPSLSTPAISGNALFVAAFDGNLYCFMAKS